MDRGPMALFAANIAGGRGRALWLGAQLGRVPAGPPLPATTIVGDETGRAPGGGAAAVEPAGPGGANDHGPTRRVANEPSLRSKRVAPRTVAPSPTPTTPPVTPSPSPSQTSAPAEEETEAPPSPDPTGSADATPGAPEPSDPAADDGTPDTPEDSRPGTLVEVARTLG